MTTPKMKPCPNPQCFDGFLLWQEGVKCPTCLGKGEVPDGSIFPKRYRCARHGARDTICCFAAIENKHFGPQSQSNETKKLVEDIHQVMAHPPLDAQDLDSAVNPANRSDLKLSASPSVKTAGLAAESINLREESLGDQFALRVKNQATGASSTLAPTAKPVDPTNPHDVRFGFIPDPPTAETGEKTLGEVLYDYRQKTCEQVMPDWRYVTGEMSTEEDGGLSDEEREWYEEQAQAVADYAVMELKERLMALCVFRESRIEGLLRELSLTTARAEELEKELAEAKRVR